ncbi:cation:proton antiporter [Carnobacterium maltaromaticum]|uniref:cation:proton antiporter domain-containing protein n=1 Tax=Carnobacterium maltaromaticum TaxID=2751 RepID=UPI0012FCB349|nr:cation:proton antiporter [Carnobacterium maltaromaticum]
MYKKEVNTLLPILEGAIILFVMVVLSNIISHYIVSIPTALIQIGLGLIVALVFGTQIELETSWFMLLFVAPLLYNDGRHYPKRDLWNLRIPIFGNSILLVFLTTVIGGYIMYFVTDGKMPLPAALALAAILSPTDPVAVNGIAERVKLPTGVLRLVRGESLVNDASGLIAFKYAIAATVTGVFSLKTATIDFFYMAIVGVLLGIVLQLVLLAIKEWLSAQGIKDVVLHTLIQILTPFIIYIIVEEIFHASGVIAVVAAGVVANNKKTVTENRMAEVRIVTERTWDVIIYLLNGMMFLILGIELPFAMRTALENPLMSNYLLFGYVILLWLVILVSRILWTYSYMWFGFSFGKTKSGVKPDFKIALMSGLTGVRGAVTMAGILSVPYLLESGEAFPQRSVMLFVASGVIVATLIAATIALPILTDSKKRFETSGDELIDFPENSVLDDPKEEELKEAQARIRIMQIAIRTIEQESRPENRMASYDLIHEYNHMIRRLQMEYNSKESIAQFLKEEIAIRLVALDAEVARVKEMRDNGEVEREIAEQYLKALARRRNALTSDWSSKFKRLWILARRFYRRNLGLFFTLGTREAYQEEYRKRLALEKEAAKSAIRSVSAFMKKDRKKGSRTDKAVAYHLIVEYRNKIERIKRYGEDYAEEYDQQLQELRLKALNAERTDIQKMFENGDISRDLATQLRRFVNYTESSVMDIGEEE